MIGKSITHNVSHIQYLPECPLDGFYLLNLLYHAHNKSEESFDIFIFYRRTNKGSAANFGVISGLLFINCNKITLVPYNSQRSIATFENVPLSITERTFLCSIRSQEILRMDFFLRIPCPHFGIFYYRPECMIDYTVQSISP